MHAHWWRKCGPRKGAVRECLERPDISRLRRAWAWATTMSTSKRVAASFVHKTSVVNPRCGLCGWERVAVGQLDFIDCGGASHVDKEARAPKREVKIEWPTGLGLQRVF